MRNFLHIFVLTALLVTRFIGIGWGLPYSFHPDEYKMALAVSDISFEKIYSGFFWAYGAFHINLAFLITQGFKILNNFYQNLVIPNPTILLRFISAFFSMLAVYYGYKLLRLLPYKSTAIVKYGAIFLFIFSPALIQLAHFGTTESILIFGLLATIYYCNLYYFQTNIQKNPIKHTKLALVLACAIAVKVVASLYLIIPILSAFYAFFVRKQDKRKSLIFFIIYCLVFVAIVLVITVLLSPHYLTNFKDMYGALQFERKFGSAELVVFYTRQFIGTRPFWYQFFKVFPYALGWPVFLLGIVGFFVAPKNAISNLARLALICYGVFFLSLFTKWTRNMAPLFGLLIFFASICLMELEKKLQSFKISKSAISIIMSIIVIISLLPGVAFLTIYLQNDIRYRASEWIYKNIPENSVIFTETANGIDIPISGNQHTAIARSYRLVPFNFYELDENPILQDQLNQIISEAQYIIVPTRRVFASHTCYFDTAQNGIMEKIAQRFSFSLSRCKKLETQFSSVNAYYKSLFSGELGFTKIKEFTAYPNITLFGKKLIEFSDESADETWSVFDHPVIRIYKKNSDY